VFAIGNPVSRFLRDVSWLRLGVLTLAVLFLGHLAWDQTRAILRYQPWGIDFLPMWAGTREAFLDPARAYNFVALTRVEHPLLGHFHGLRPFVYPPPALLAFTPFALASFDLANGLWIAATLLLLLAVLAGQIKHERGIILLAMVLSPASVLVMITGQVTFLIAALTVMGLLCLKTRPWVAGVLFGLAGSIKPQAMFLLPVALVAIGQWRTLGAACATAVATSLASIALFGFDAWVQWLAAVPRFEHLVMSAPAMVRGMITPTSIALWAGVGRESLGAWSLGFAALAVGLVWAVFRRTEDLPRRLTALLGGAIFVTPYAMHYDAALLAPAAALLISRRTGVVGWLLSLLAGGLLCCAAVPHWGAAAVTAFVLLVLIVPESTFNLRIRTPRLVVQPNLETAA
jgi:hypothetical protein